MAVTHLGVAGGAPLPPGAVTLTMASIKMATYVRRASMRHRCRAVASRSAEHKSFGKPFRYKRSES